MARQSVEVERDVLVAVRTFQLLKAIFVDEAALRQCRGIGEEQLTRARGLCDEFVEGLGGRRSDDERRVCVPGGLGIRLELVEARDVDLRRLAHDARTKRDDARKRSECRPDRSRDVDVDDDELIGGYSLDLTEKLLEGRAKAWSRRGGGC